MTKPALKTLKYEKVENFLPFQETFLTHIKNCIMTYEVNNQNKNIFTQFVENLLWTIEDYRTNVENYPNNDTAANTFHLRFKAIDTYLFFLQLIKASSVTLIIALRHITLWDNLYGR